MSTGDNGGGSATREGTHEQLLVEAGVLDSLSARLGSFVVAEKSVKTPTKTRAETDIPPPAPQSAKLAPILDAISVIIKDSKLRSLEFLFSPSLTALFPPSTINPNSSDARPSSSNKNGEGTPGTTSSIKLPQPKSTSSSIIQPPQLLITPSAFPPLTPSSSHFPPLSASASHGSADYSSLQHYSTQHYHHHSVLTEAQPMLLESGGGDDSESSAGGDTPLRQRAETAEAEDIILHSSNLESASVSGEADIEIEESTLIPWLISQVRSGDPTTRLMATGVLTNLFKVGLVGKRMAQLLVLLVLPVLVRLLNEDEMLTKVSVGVGGVDLDTWEKWTIQERAPAILARLVMDSTEMQKAAVDAGAIKRLAIMLRRAAEPPSPSPSANGVTSGDSAEVAAAERSKQNTPEVTHRMKVKEGTFRCLASLALFKDEYRKLIIDAGVVPMVVSSMKPLEPIPNAPVSQETTTGEGNPPSVLIAACGVVRALSRSVSILRTSLIDAGVAMPLLALLRHDDIEVRVSSTAAVCNLVLDFSPMRQSIVDAGVLEVLCVHAKSRNASLRLNALWALKHLILDAESGVKRKCFEGLGMDWFVEVISGDAQGEEMSEDEEMGESGEGEGAMEDSIGDLKRLDGGRATDEEYYDAPEERTRSKSRKLPPKAAVVMAQLERKEPGELTMRRKQSIAMQEQGLDFIRNFICNKDRTEMIDLLFDSMGKDRLFEMLEEKLRPRTLKRRTGGGTILELPPGEVVSSIVYILVHVAVGAPSHRQILIQRTELLRLLSSLWNHRLPNVRCGLAWVVINLTWIEESEDVEEVRSRTRELIRLGFDKSLEGMLQDSEMDVRERVKTAKYQMESSVQGEQALGIKLG